MPSKCILFYKTDRTDARAEAVIDRETAAGRLELVGVSAPEGAAVPKERQSLPFYPPETLPTVDFAYAIVTEASAAAQRDRRRSRVKRLLPPALLRLYARSGVDGIEVSGTEFNCRAGQRSPFYLDELLRARGTLSTPLILVGGIFSRQTAEDVLRHGIRLVSFSRALIREPDFAANLKSGVQEESRCRACNACYTIYRSRFVRCVQHTEKIPQLEKVFGR